MSVEKIDGALLRNEKLPFTIHLNYVCQNLRNPLALAIWCYLTSLPDDWKIYRTELMKHFEVGRDKINHALTFLNQKKLLEYEQGRNEKGVFEDSYIKIKCGLEFMEQHKKLSTDDPAGTLKTRCTDYPLHGETAPTKETLLTKEEKRKKRESSLDFLPDKENIEFAKRLNVNIEEELESFKNRCKGKKTQYEFGRWLVNAKEHAEKRKVGKFKNKPQESGSTVKFFEPGNPDYDRLHGIG